MPSTAPSRPRTPLTEHVLYRPALLFLALGPWVGVLVGWWMDGRSRRRQS